MGPIGNQIDICPRNIRYTQDSIKAEFTDGTAMWDTMEDLLYGRVTVDNLPLIEVVRDEGKWWALTGNRRLYLYRKLEELQVVHTIPVITVSLDSDRVQRQLDKRKTTECEGVAIRLRGQNQPDWNITQVINNWKTAQRDNRRYGVPSGQTMDERSGSQRGRSLERNSSNRIIPPVVIHQPSIPPVSVSQRSKSVERGSSRSIQRPNVPEASGTNPMTGSIRSSSNVRIGSGRDFPRSIAPSKLDRSDSSRMSGGWMKGQGIGQNDLEPQVITIQPRRSTSLVKSSNDSGCSCCDSSCCSCCCCCCFPCCKRPTD